MAASFLLAMANPALAQAPAVTPPSKLSWHGDAKAPDISGLWVRTDKGVGQGSKEGWLPWPPPLKPQFEAIWHKRVADAAAGGRADDPVQGCLPPGMPRFMSGTNGPLLIIQTPGRVMLYRELAPVRRIWLAGPGLPKPADLEGFSNGNAIGRYEGADLVTEVVGFKDYPIDGTGVPHSDALKIVERFHRVDAKTLRVEITLTDPIAFTGPMKTVVTYAALDDPAWSPKEFLCTPKTDYHPEAYVR
ncbi:MAG: hypothetical protein H0X36_04615 [Sphingomonadaceae bacterium]|nr:hypothetical protein [Sphingomonadaceae bacterium]